MSGKNRNKAKLQHILDAIFEIEDYVQSVDFTEFTKNRMMQSACIRQLEIIGEAANYISDEAKNMFNDIEWREIVGLRNLLIHEYFGVDIHVIWGIIQNDLPPFKKRIKKLLKILD